MAVGRTAAMGISVFTLMWQLALLLLWASVYLHWYGSWPYGCCGHKCSYTNASAVEQRHILAIQNALVQSVWCVMEHTDYFLVSSEDGNKSGVRNLFLAF